MTPIVEGELAVTLTRDGKQYKVRVEWDAKQAVLIHDLDRFLRSTESVGLFVQALKEALRRVEQMLSGFIDFRASQ